MKAQILLWLQSNKKLVKRIVIVIDIIGCLIILAWVLSSWLEKIIGKIDYEPIYALVTIVIVSLNRLYSWLLNESEYSPAYALATGYVDNFISPVITQLIENGDKKPLIYIFKPEDITELFPNNIDRLKAQIRNKPFILKEIQLDLKHGRARDILTIEKSNDKKVHFDFPNTLISLLAYIDYKVPTKADHSPDRAKAELTKKLIGKFYEKVDELLVKRGINDNIRYCDKNFKFSFAK